MLSCSLPKISVVVSVVSLVMLWNRKYQQFDQVVSSVTAKVKGVAQMQLPGEGAVIWDEADYSGFLQVRAQVHDGFISYSKSPPRCDYECESHTLCVFWAMSRLFFLRHY